MNIVQQFKYNNSNEYELIKGIQKQVICVWEQYSKILQSLHFVHVIWHRNVFCSIFVRKMSLWVCCDIIRLIWTW